MGDSSLYLTTLECSSGHTVTVAHEGEERAPTEEAPPPAVNYCTLCGDLFPEDLGLAIVEVREAAVLPPPDAREDTGWEDMTEEERRSWAWQHIESQIPGRGRKPPRDGGGGR